MKRNQPPRWASALLSWWADPNTLEEVQGDLLELYAYWVQTVGVRKANWRYVLSVLKLLRPLAKPKNDYPITYLYSPTMIRNYFKIAFRNLSRNKVYATINVSGLALGMSCGILIFAIITYHLSFDKFHPNADRIYRFVTEMHRETVSYSPGVPAPLGKVFRDDYAFGEKVARIATFGDVLITVKSGNNILKFKEEQGISFAESDFFNIFDYPLASGQAGPVLTEPNTAILTTRMAKKLFGNVNPVNKTFRLDNKIDLRITGVLQNLPANTDRQAEIYISYSTLGQYEDWLADEDDWGAITREMQCFVLLRAGVAPDKVEQLMPAYVKKYRSKSKNIHHYKLQPLSDIHFNAQYGGKMAKTTIWVLGLVGLFLIVTACINFINLATAQVLHRTREVGVRKVLGSLNRQLFLQFIAETGVITVVAVVLAGSFSMLALPYVNALFKSKIAINPFDDWHLAAFIIILTAFITLLAGSYPGLILARFQPIWALKGRATQKYTGGGFNIRRGLIVAQFAISQVLIIGVIVIASQMRYATKSDLGFTKEAVVMLPMASETESRTMTTLKERFSALTGVDQVSLCRAAPTADRSWNTSVRYDNREEAENFSISIRSADNQYIPLFGLKLIAGRNLYPSDTAREFVVNEMFAKKLNLKSAGQLIGKTISMNGGTTEGLIVGVVQDFHDRSLREDINAVCLTSQSDDYRNYAVKINMADAKKTLSMLEKAWSEMHPDQMFEYQFLDDQIVNFYQSEAILLNLIEIFAGIAIFIGCMGLYGLVSFMAAQKTKEVGIRKVLGSSIGQIVGIFAREFSLLILIAFVIASPIAWWAMNTWLQLFKYKVGLGIGVFALAIAGTFLIAILTVSHQAIKAALMNPVTSLRSE